MEKLDLDKKSLKNFAITMGFAFLAIAGLFYLKHKQINPVLAEISLTFFILGLISPGILKPVYIVWMKLAFVLGWINTRLILMIMFYLVITPIGLGLKLFGVDLLDKKMDNKSSYWKIKEKKAFDPADYEKQF